jgi:hypothetical protein
MVIVRRQLAREMHSPRLMFNLQLMRPMFNLQLKTRKTTSKLTRRKMTSKLKEKTPQTTRTYQTNLKRSSNTNPSNRSCQSKNDKKPQTLKPWLRWAVLKPPSEIRLGLASQKSHLIPWLSLHRKITRNGHMPHLEIWTNRSRRLGLSLTSPNSKLEMLNEKSLLMR